MGVEIAMRAAAEHGASPTWDTGTSTLLWVDTPVCRVHRFDPATGREDVLDLPQRVGAAKPRTGGGLACNLTDGVALLDRDGTRRWLTYWARDGASCGDAAVDPMGRLWAGSTGWLSVVEPSGDARVVLPDVDTLGGMAWSPDERLAYLVGPAALDVAEFDTAGATLTGRRTLVDLRDARPAGACVDADGCVWVGLAGAVHRYTPGGRLDRAVAVPAGQVTGVAFGGSRLTDLYLTSVASSPASTSPDGALFVLPDTGSGLPSTTFAG